MPNAVLAGILFWGVLEILPLGSIVALRPAVSSLEDVSGPGEENVKLAWKLMHTRAEKTAWFMLTDSLSFCVCLFVQSLLGFYLSLCKICLWQCVHKLSVWLVFVVILWRCRGLRTMRIQSDGFSLVWTSVRDVFRSCCAESHEQECFEAVTSDFSLKHPRPGCVLFSSSRYSSTCSISTSTLNNPCICVFLHMNHTWKVLVEKGSFGS